jgi:hypothetical protein
LCLGPGPLASARLLAVALVMPLSLKSIKGRPLDRGNPKPVISI